MRKFFMVCYLFYTQLVFSQGDTSIQTNEYGLKITTPVAYQKMLTHDSIDGGVLGFAKLPSFLLADSFYKSYKNQLETLKYKGYYKLIPFCNSSYKEVIFFTQTRYRMIKGLEIVKAKQARKTDILPIRLSLKKLITDCYRISLDDKYEAVLKKLCHLPIFIETKGVRRYIYLTGTSKNPVNGYPWYEAEYVFENEKLVRISIEFSA